MIYKSLVMLGFWQVRNKIPSSQRLFQFRSPSVRQYEKRSFSSGAFDDGPASGGHDPCINAMVTNPAQLSATNEQLPRARSKRNSRAFKWPFFSIFLLAWTKRWSAAGPRPRDFDFDFKNLKILGMNGYGAVKLSHPHPDLPPSRRKEQGSVIINKSLMMSGFRRVRNKIPSSQQLFNFAALQSASTRSEAFRRAHSTTLWSVAAMLRD